MSARTRIIKRRIRELEREQQHLVELSQAFTVVIGYAASKIPISTLRDLTRLQDEIREQFYQSNIQQQREEELLASMPKRHGESPHDPGDEHEHRSQKAGERG